MELFIDCVCVTFVNYSSWRDPATYEINHALVAMLGIGEYCDRDDLIGVTKDYKNIIHTFYKQFGYSIVYYDNHDILQYCNKKPNILNQEESKNDDTLIEQTKLPQENQSKSAFKLNWSVDEIEKFIENVNEIVQNTHNQHDSLIFFISSHGDNDHVIIDSDGEEVQLMSIFDKFFGQSCPYLLDKPKIFFIDGM